MVDNESSDAIQHIMELPAADILHGDCLEVLKTFPDQHFDLIITSPPYADRRANTYGGVKPDRYVEWFLPGGAGSRPKFVS